jgi:hypothetical protein
VICPAGIASRIRLAVSRSKISHISQATRISENLRRRTRRMRVRRAHQLLQVDQLDATVDFGGLTQTRSRHRAGIAVERYVDDAVAREPSFFAEVEYRDITSEGLLRQSSFIVIASRIPETVTAMSSISRPFPRWFRATLIAAVGRIFRLAELSGRARRLRPRALRDKGGCLAGPRCGPTPVAPTGNACQPRRCDICQS